MQLERKIKKHRRSLALLSALAIFITGCSSSKPDATAIPETTLAAGTVTAIDSAISEAMQLAKATEAVVGVWSESGDYVSAFSSGSSREFDARALFRGAQTNQPILCALVLQLESEGSLKLDREVSRDIPRQTGIGDVTYRQLCDGTSGLPDFKGKFTNIYLENPTRTWPSGQLIAEALIQPKLSWPGLDVHRSDSDAVLLGRALSVLAEGDLPEMLEEKVFEPAEMFNTDIVESGTNLIPGDNSLAGTGFLPGPNCEAGPVDFTELSVTMLGNSGNTITTVSDIKNFYTHLFNGTFGGEAGLQTLTTVQPTDNPKRDSDGNVTEEPENPTSFRGFGVLKEGSLWGYNGALPGSATAAWHNPETGFTVVVALNNSTAGAGFASNLAKAIAAITGEPGLTWTVEEMNEKLVAAEVCPPVEEDDEG